jgi:hypothetical protein
VTSVIFLSAILIGVVYLSITRKDATEVVFHQVAVAEGDA